ncbi:unnamed protein product [Macrosiphum euphorbiae]|uniref:Uncharacterized protein n=1 Tax=Macrosiphum euphorbiae TaxID=13131 RepID=A0AAV0VEQ8_9HEMI|nr:unnamed protein product [Macrosiphum euphorbiae]
MTKNPKSTSPPTNMPLSGTILIHQTKSSANPRYQPHLPLKRQSRSTPKHRITAPRIIVEKSRLTKTRGHPQCKR